MKMTRIGIKDIRFTDGSLPNGDGVIHASIQIGTSHQVSAEARYRYSRSMDAEIRRLAIHELLQAVYGDVWDLARYAEILIRQEMPTRWIWQSYGPPEARRPVFRILEILGRIGKSDDGIEQVLEPYRNPEGRPKK